MTATVDPSLYRRKLRFELRQAREGAGLTQRESAAELDWSLSKIIRIETGTVSVSLTDLRAMLQLYRVDSAEKTAELENAARGSKGSSWWSAYSDVLSPQFGQYLSYEGAASSIHAYHPIIVPGQLQTQDYALALLEPHIERSRANRVVDLRMVRQEKIFEVEEPPETTFILDEATIHRRIGTVSVMKQQLGHLIEQGARDDVTIRVLPFTVGAHYSTLGSFIILGFKDDQDLVYLEHATGSVTSGNDLELLARYQECFDDILRRSLTEEDSTEMIIRMREELSRS